MSIGILPGGLFESQTVKQKRILENDAMFSKISLNNQYFGHLELAVDGGLSREVEELYSPMRLFTMAINCFLVVFNLSRVFLDDLEFMRSTASYWHGQGVLDHFFHKRLGLHATVRPQHIVAYCELAGIAFLVVVLAIQIISSLKSNSEFVRWLSVARIFREIIPEMKTYSAMRMLSHVSPYVIIREWKASLGDVQDRRAEGEKLSRLILELLFFVFVRIAILILGLNAFVVRFKGVQDHIGATEVASIIKSVMFMNQMLGIVQVERLATQRIALFVFGGEDTYISAGEDRVMLAWWAKLHERMWLTNRPLPAFAMFMSFNDKDFQKLMLNERAIQIPAGLEQKSPRSSSPALRRRHTTPTPGLGATGLLQKTTKIVMPAPVHPTHDSDKLL